MVSLLFLYGMNCCSLDKAEITSPRALKLLLMDWASYETHKTSDINEKSYGAGGGGGWSWYYTIKVVPVFIKLLVNF